jgi:site-specific DNA-methyltransferase (adenine-specific)
MQQFKVESTKTISFGTNGRINYDSSKFYNSKLYKTLNTNKIFQKNPPLS